MITGLRSVLMAAKVETDDDGHMNILGLVGDALLAESSPGFVDPWLFLAVETDGRAAAGHLTLAAPEYSLDVPFTIPDGIHLTAMTFPILIPVLRAALLHIAVIDDAKPTKPFKTSWKMDFYPDPQVLGEEAAQSVIEAARQSAENLTNNLTGRRLN